MLVAVDTENVRKFQHKGLCLSDMTEDIVHHIDRWIPAAGNSINYLPNCEMRLYTDCYKINKAEILGKPTNLLGISNASETLEK